LGSRLLYLAHGQAQGSGQQKCVFHAILPQ
jgi:hypothetical protein